MKQISTLILKTTVFFLGAVVLALCIFWTPMFAREASEFVPELARLRYVIIIAWNSPAIPFFIALYQALKLLGYIDKNTAFSDLSVKALQKIKHCAVSICVLYLTAYMPIIYFIAETDDAPGVILIGLAVTCIPVAVATFAAILQRLLGDALEMKSENDLTI